MLKDNENQFLKGTVALSLSVILTKILGVLFKVPLSYILGDDGMGYFNSAYAIYGFFYILCTAGVPKSLTLILAKNRIENAGEGEEAILKTGLRLFGLIGGVCTLTNILCAPAFIYIIGNSRAYWSLIAVAPSIMFVSMSGVLRGYLNSHERLSEVAVSQLIEGGVKLALGLLLAYAGVKVKAPIYIISALAILGITVGCLISFWYMYIKSNNLKKKNKIGQSSKLSRRKINTEIVKNALPISLSSSLLNICAVLDLTIIIKQLIASGLSEQQANSVYGNYTTLAVPMFNLVIAVLTPIATSYMSRLSHFGLIDDKAGFMTNFNSLIFITAFVAVPASVSFILYSFDILDVLFSVQSSAVGAETLTYLSVGLPFLSLLTAVNTALESKRKIGISVVSLLCGAAVKIVVSYVLISKYNFGILGAPIGTAFSYFVSLMISTFSLEACGVRTRLLRMMLSMYIISTVSFYFPYKLIYSSSLFGSSFVSMAISLIISFSAYLALTLFFTLLKRKNIQNSQKEIINLG